MCHSVVSPCVCHLCYLQRVTLFGCVGSFCSPRVVKLMRTFSEFASVLFTGLFSQKLYRLSLSLLQSVFKSGKRECNMSFLIVIASVIGGK